MQWTLTIPGVPVVLKNSKQVVAVKRPDGRTVRIPRSNKRVEAWMHKAMAELCDQWGSEPPIAVPVNLAIRSYGPWRSGAGNVPDASNLYEAPQDALQQAGVLVDDGLVESHDGSRRICLCDTCERRLVIRSGPRKGQLKDNCGAVKSCWFPKVVITITTVDE